MMSVKVMIVEDDSALTELLCYNLEAEGFHVVDTDNGDDAEIMVAEERPDLVVLDWMLPAVSGIEICRRLRARQSTRAIPILMLTARGEEADRVRGLETGADDYITKPFSVPELIARIKALLRRASPNSIAEILRVSDMQLDRAAHRVTRGQREVNLGPTEFKLLEFLMQSPGRVFSRSQLLDGVWGRDAFIDERTVDVHIGRLRKALIRGKETDPIRTVRGAGYVIGERQSDVA